MDIKIKDARILIVDDEPKNAEFKEILPDILAIKARYSDVG